jgi:hypothetical protein
VATFFPIKLVSFSDDRQRNPVSKKRWKEGFQFEHKAPWKLVLANWPRAPIRPFGLYQILRLLHPQSASSKTRRRRRSRSPSTHNWLLSSSHHCYESSSCTWPIHGNQVPRKKERYLHKYWELIPYLQFESTWKELRDELIIKRFRSDNLSANTEIPTLKKKKTKRNLKTV